VVVYLNTWQDPTHLSIQTALLTILVYLRPYQIRYLIRSHYTSRRIVPGIPRPLLLYAHLDLLNCLIKFHFRPINCYERPEGFIVFFAFLERYQSL